MIECLSTGDIVDKESASSASVVGTGNRAEGFLACGVPNLKFNLFAVDVDHASTEFYSNGQVMDGLEGKIGDK